MCLAQENCGSYRERGKQKLKDQVDIDRKT